MALLQLRTIARSMRGAHISQRAFATSARRCEAAAPSTPKSETAAVVDAEPREISQSPNRAAVWSRSQKPRSQAMTGPRFEQTDFDLQPQPLSAIELIHKVPVTWVHERIVVCEGGGGAAGHPKIYINTDKAEIATCNYCGKPFANEHHRKYFESLPQTSYPLA